MSGFTPLWTGWEGRGEARDREESGRGAGRGLACLEVRAELRVQAGVPERVLEHAQCGEIIIVESGGSGVRCRGERAQRGVGIFHSALQVGVP